MISIRALLGVRRSIVLASLSCLLLAFSLAAPAHAAEPWYGTYVPDMSGMELSPQMRSMMAGRLPTFRFAADKVQLVAGGKVHSTSSYKMDGQVAVVDSPDGIKRMVFSDDWQSFTPEGDPDNIYIRQ